MEAHTASLVVLFARARLALREFRAFQRIHPSAGEKDFNVKVLLIAEPRLGVIVEECDALCLNETECGSRCQCHFVGSKLSSRRWEVFDEACIVIAVKPLNLGRYEARTSSTL